MRKDKQLLLALTLFCSTGSGQNCSAVSGAQKSKLVDYVRKEYKLQQETDLQLTEDRPVNTACYRELTFRGKSSAKTWEINLYLSPDERFLTNELLDITVDPAEERQRKIKALMTGLAENKATSRGRDTAPVTLVEFSDFECPFCRKFANVVAQVLPEEKDDVRLVFHHMPLSIHSWARTAAEGAACAQLQGNDAFWSMHDQLFEHQQEITPTNVKEKLLQYAQNTKALDMGLFKTCVNDEMSLGLVFRDMNLATTNDVQGTPTLFVNGRRIPGVKDANQLRELITEAKNEARLPRSTQPESAAVH